MMDLWFVKYFNSIQFNNIIVVELNNKSHGIGITITASANRDNRGRASCVPLDSYVITECIFTAHT